MYHLQLSFLKEMFQENCYPENFISLICFEQNLYHKEKLLTVEKKLLRLFRHYLGTFSLQIRTK